MNKLEIADARQCLEEALQSTGTQWTMYSESRVRRALRLLEGKLRLEEVTTTAVQERRR